MSYLSLEKQIIDDPIKFLEDGQESFNELNNVSEGLKNGNTNSPDDIQEILKKVTGLYLFISPRYSISKTTKLNEENREYINYKISMEKEGTKFVSAVAEKHSKHETAIFRRIENAYEGYLESCKTCINVCQSLLRYMNEEKLVSKQMES